MCKFNSIAGAATASRSVIRSLQKPGQPTPGTPGSGGGQDGVGQGQTQTPAAPSDNSWGGRKY